MRMAISRKRQQLAGTEVVKEMTIDRKQNGASSRDDLPYLYSSLWTAFSRLPLLVVNSFWSPSVDLIPSMEHRRGTVKSCRVHNCVQIAVQIAVQKHAQSADGGHIYLQSRFII